MTTCPTHGFHNGLNGCPTCLRIDAARDLLSQAPHGRTARHRRARELLADLGERAGDGFRDAGGVSFDLGGAA